MDTLNRFLRSIYTPFKRASIARAMAMFVLVLMAYPVTAAHAETRTLKLYFLHTGERSEITYKKNGRYVKSGLKKINRFLRDWRRNEPTKMNPRLLDLIWEVHKETRSRKHIHVISGYRSPATNGLLRKRGRGVAKKSQHTLGNALDFFIPGVKLSKLRNIGLRKGLGGVGYYPKSGSPFVHMDTGRVRHWPRMNRKQLVSVFPKGKTLHVPTDGKPLPGYNVAKANYERALKGKSRTRIASAEEIKKKPSILAKLFARNNDDDEGVTIAPVRVKPTIVKPKPNKPANVVKKPEPIEVPEVIETPETRIAALAPNQVPVPILAPRIAIAKPPEPEIAPEIAIAETQVVSLEPIEQEVKVEELTQEVALAIPVPSQRPSNTIPSLDIIEGTVVPTLPIPNTSVRVAALSSNEITDLRQQVYATLERDITQPETIQIAEQIPFKPATPLPTTQSRERIPFAPPTELAKSDVPSLIQSASSAINQQVASSEPNLQTIQDTQVLSVKPQAALTLITALLPEETISNLEIKAPKPEPAFSSNIPVPQKASRPVIQPTVKIAANIPTQEITKPISKAQTADRPLSIEEFKTANLDTRLAGKWALATDASIKDIADIQPPAYGKNILRQSPSNVLSRGFTQDQLGTNTNGFSGSSLEFLDFTKFTK